MKLIDKLVLRVMDSPTWNKAEEAMLKFFEPEYFDKINELDARAIHVRDARGLIKLCVESFKYNYCYVLKRTYQLSWGK